MNNELEQIVTEVNKVVKGKERVVRKVLAAVLAGGHVLLEDIPGVGKTTLAMALGKSMDLEYKRMQFTPDVLPSDIVGFTMYNSRTGEFEYKQGAIFCNLFLADELNRTSSKTQSALLEVMEESKVTVDGIAHQLPNPFTVIATENPFGSSGTQMLPESQLDRFLICLNIGYPSHEAAVDILRGSAGIGLNQVQSVISVERLLELRKLAANLHVEDSVLEYITNLAEATRQDTRIALGVSPRGSIALLKMARSMALMRGGDYVIPEDVRAVSAEVLRHRIGLTYEVEQYGAENIVFFSELRQGSPFNALVSLTRDYDIYHITGTNLAMLMAVIIERDDEDISAEELCEAAMEAVEGSMLNVRQFLKEQIEDCDEEEDL